MTKLLHPNLNPAVLDELTSLNKDELLAAIDLGSNSFHLAIARIDHGEIRKILSLSDKVQLAAGLDDNHLLSDTAMQRGLDCLQRFLPHISEIAPERLRIVATNALRKAVNAHEFIRRANAFLPKPIEVIAGREEARLIYLGVSHTNASIDKRLVIDIGGGSTEFIIGQGFEPIEVESLQMGCVSFSKKFFAHGKISQKAFDDAEKAAESELLTIAKRYKKTGWSHVMGSSGTIKACFLAIQELGFAEGITLSAMKKLTKYLINIGDSRKIPLESVKVHRHTIFAAGVAELYAIMKVLGIEQMDYSDGALREGVMYDMLGRQSHEDVRHRSVEAMAQRYAVSPKQAGLVYQAVMRLFDDNADVLGLDKKDRDLLGYAASLHEVGLGISHSSYHQHSSYLLKHSDMFGFSRLEQDKLALLVLCHRRKLKAELLEQVQSVGGTSLVVMCLLLRLAVLSCQSRSRHSATIRLSVEKGVWSVVVGQGNYVSLIVHQLQAEVAQFAKWGIKLVSIDE